METPATAPQLNYLALLANTRPAWAARTGLNGNADQMDKQTASRLIDEAKQLPPETAPHRSDPSALPLVDIASGSYWTNAGEVARVRPSQAGRLYAEQLSEETGRFEYVRGLIFRLRARMTLQVRPWYPFPLAVVPDPETQAEIDRKKAERLAYLQDLNRQRRELRNGKGEKKKMAADRWTEQIRHFGAGIGPRIEQTEAGAQVVAPGTPPRTIPMSGLQPKTPQKDGPLPLELAEINAKQQRLF